MASRNLGTIVFAMLLLAAFCTATFIIVKVAGGTDVSPSYSNTPNAVVPGPPAFK